MLHFWLMTRTFKTFLLWLLIAVMPFQAFATNVLRVCSSGHQGMTMATLTPAAHGEEAANTPDALMDQQSADDEECVEVTSSADHNNDTPDSPKFGSCSACAACCVGAFAPPPMLSFKPSSNDAEVHETFGATLVVGFIPDSLERPPRHLAA
jgi:hypothetical protein